MRSYQPGNYCERFITSLENLKLFHNRTSLIPSVTVVMICQKGPLTFSDIYKILNNVAIYVLMSI